MSLSSDGAVMTMPVTPAYQGGNGGFGGWGGDWSSWIILFLIWGIFGWGNGGYGGFGGGGGVNNPGLQGLATRSDINEGFALNGLQTGQSSILSAVTNGFHGVDSAICNLGNTVQSGFNATQVAMMQGQNALQSQLAQCCCDQRAATQDLKYTIATEDCATRNLMQSNTRDIIDSQNNGINAIMGKLSQMEYNGLNDKYQAALAENQALKFQASQTTQNGFIDAVGNSIVARLQQPTPIPAYMVPNPNCCYSGCGNCG